MGRTDLGSQLLGHGLDIADQQIVVDLFEWRFVGEGLVDQHRSLHDLLPPPQARGKPGLVTRVLRETQPVLLAVGNVTEAVDGDVRVRQRHALGSISVFDDLVLLGQERGTADPARRQNAVAVGAAKKIAGYRRFESISLQRGVTCEPEFSQDRSSRPISSSA
ncbi:MAG TPA: hypothetical protein VNN75_11385 [Stellaceae bacterium]|nr:hypothetical protein [Stellaceae bacterium]